MTDTPRTPSYLAGTLFADGQPPGSITPQAVRDFIVSSMGYYESVTWHGAKGDGVTNDWAAFSGAIATGRPVYVPYSASGYLINDQLNFTTPGQMMFGDGKGRSTIQVSGGFNMAASGLFSVAITAVPGPQFRDFSVNYAQPDTSGRASLTNYPDCFHVTNSPRCTWDGIKINAAMTAINLTGALNGGASIRNCELCAFNKHVAIDGAQDTITITTTRFENDLLTTNQSIIYATTGTVGLSVGRCDDLHVTDCLFVCGTMISTFDGTVSGATGSVYGEIVGCDLDSYNGILMQGAGQLTIAGCNFTQLTSSNYGISQTNGMISMASCNFWTAAVLVSGIVLINPAAGKFVENIMSACRFNVEAGDFSAIQVIDGSSSECTITIGASRFLLPTNSAKIHPAININGIAKLSLTGCRFNLAGPSGSGNALSISTDNTHNITGNAFGGWGQSLPGGHTLLVFANNN